MSTDASVQAGSRPGWDQVPPSALEHHEYCPRQAALILLEDGFADDAATVRGTLLHQRVHEPGEEARAGVRSGLSPFRDGDTACRKSGFCDSSAASGAPG